VAPPSTDGTREPEVRATAVAALFAPADDVDARLANLVGALVPAIFDGCEVELFDARGNEVGTFSAHRDDGLSSAIRGLDALRAQVLERRRTQVWRSNEGTQTCVVACVQDGDDAIGTIACLTTDPRRGLDEDDAAGVEDVGRLAGVAVGHELLQRHAREAARRSQRLASQLHQLIAASIAVAGLQREADVIDALATRARGVFDADEAVVTLDSGPGSPLTVVAQRADGAARRTAGGPESLALPASARSSTAAVREGDWLVAPLLVRRGETRGAVSIRRRPEATFSDDDVEVASLLAQMASSALDATEMHRTILRSEERLRVLVDTAPIGIVETDLDGGIEWWNRAAGHLFSWPDVGTVDASAAPTFPGVALDALRDLWVAAAAGETVSAHDLSGVELAGRRRELAASVALVPPAQGRRGSLLTVVEDVTDHRQLMEELRHAQRMDVIGQLSSSVAHDFNNLLTLIAGYAELLALEAGGDARTAQLAKDIQTTTTRASTLTGKLLTMGRTKLPAPVVFSPVASVEELSEVLDRIIGADVALRLSLDDTTGTIRADPDQFEQMIMNLATNARDAMGDGGELRIEIEPQLLLSDRAASLGLDAGDYVRIELADTGAGMDEETLRRCFEPLFTTKGPSKGTGLGLPAARRVVIESGGSITATSTPGVGTTFEILFPMVGDVAVVDAGSTAPIAQVESATILLAEDDEGIRELLGKILRHNGFEVLETESAERALEVARSWTGVIDLLVSDVVMTGMTGGELAAQLQSERPEVLVVLVSGNVDATVVDAVAEGTGAFLAKPFKPSELIGVIAELRGRRDEPGTSAS
jgi:two-component system, cell cycle sensor histidine kinase and response regulator CckA